MTALLPPDPEVYQRYRVRNAHNGKESVWMWQPSLRWWRACDENAPHLSPRDAWWFGWRFVDVPACSRCGRERAP